MTLKNFTPSGMALIALMMPAGLLTACHARLAPRSRAAHSVAVRPVTALSKTVTASLTGRVSPRGEDSTRSGVQVSDYRILVEIPDGAQTTLTAGQTVAVTLPLIHHQEARATVEKTRVGGVDLLLARQVQELNGQEVRVEIPLRGEGVFRLPFAAVYSPRGLSKRVLAIKGEQVESRDIKVIALAGDRDVLVTGKLQSTDTVVVQGLDNLLPGDAVQVLAGEDSK